MAHLVFGECQLDKCGWFVWKRVIVVVLFSVVLAVKSINIDPSTRARCPSPMKISWFIHSPFTNMKQGNGKRFKPGGVLSSVVDATLEYCCPDYGTFEVGYDKIKKVANEREMLFHLWRNKSNIGFPIVSQPSAKKNKGHRFLPLISYSNLVFLTVEKELDPGSVVVKAVLKSWPLLVIPVLMAALAGVIAWSLDTIHNPEQFPRSFLRGSWEGFWLTFVSMTTVGYGDKAPRSFGARVFAVVWIFFGLVIIAIFMANITTALTAASLEYDADLFNKSVQDIVETTKTNEVDGVLMNRYAAALFLRNFSNPRPLVGAYFEVKLAVGMVLAGGNNNWINSVSKCVLEELQEELQKEDANIAEEFEQLARLKRKGKKATFNLFDHSSNVDFLTVHTLFGSLVGILLLGVIVEFGLERLKQDGTSNKTGPLKETYTTTKTWREEMTQLQRSFDETKQMIAQLQNSLESVELQLKESAETQSLKA